MSENLLWTTLATMPAPALATADATKPATKTRVARKRRNERNTLTFYEKIAVIRYQEEGNLSRQKLAKMFHCCATQIRRVLDNKDQLLQQLASISEKDASFIVEEMTHKRRKFEMRAIGFLLHQWVERCRQYRINIRITNQTLKSTALKMAALLNLPTFRPSYRWLQRFRGLYKYEEEFDLGCSGPGTISGEVPVEDIIIEFQESLPAFMKKEITSITDNGSNNTSNNANTSTNKKRNTNSNTVNTASTVVAALRNAMQYPEVVYSSNENSRDTAAATLKQILSGQQSMCSNEQNVVEIDDDDDDDDDGDIDYNNDDIIVVPDPVQIFDEHNETNPRANSNHGNNLEDSSSPEQLGLMQDGNAVLATLFPHLAMLHQFSLLQSDAKALELISQLGIHFQTQALIGAYDMSMLSAEALQQQLNNNQQDNLIGDELPYTNFDDIQLIE